MIYYFSGSRSLNEEAVALEEAANCFYDSLLVGFRFLFDILYSHIRKEFENDG